MCFFLTMADGGGEMPKGAAYIVSSAAPLRSPSWCPRHLLSDMRTATLESQSPKLVDDMNGPAFYLSYFYITFEMSSSAANKSRDLSKFVISRARMYRILGGRQQHILRRAHSGLPFGEG
ncbi:hypothetical protein JMJ78_0013226 [Colletotrichum scovillei]|nr:hypothetical protein JMJ78_0013226 [Colletotrichum scovillei]